MPRDVATATVGPTADQHAFPNCFVCGPTAPDGLHICAGPVPDGSSTVHLSVITPGGELARSLVITGTADVIGGRIVPAALHLLRAALVTRD